MENSKQCLKSATQYYLLYIFIALLATPVVIYSFAFCAEKYLLGNDVSFENIMNSSALDDASLIIGNLLIIVVFIKRKYIRLTISKNLRAEISRDKKLYLWAILLKLSSLLPINLFVAFLDLNDYSVANSGNTLSMAGILGICLLLQKSQRHGLLFDARNKQYGFVPDRLAATG